MNKISVLFVASGLAACLAACTVTTDDGDAGSLFTGGSTGTGGAVVGAGGSGGTDAAPTGTGGTSTTTSDAATSDAPTTTPEASPEATTQTPQFSQSCQACINGSTVCNAAYTNCRFLTECSQKLNVFIPCFNASGSLDTCIDTAGFGTGDIDSGLVFNDLGECLENTCAGPCAPPADAGATD